MATNVSRSKWSRCLSGGKYPSVGASAMHDDEILLKLTPIFREVFDDENVTPVLEMMADDVEEWDSLSNVRLIASIEKQFGVRFTASEVGELDNVGDLVSLIKQKKG
jgi:acyl carrier protein